MAMNLGWWVKEYCPKCKRQKWLLCEKSTAWHFETNCAAVKFAEPWMLNHFSESRDHSYTGSAMCPECPSKHWWGKSCRLHPRKGGPEVDQGPGGAITSPTLLGFVIWCEVSRTIGNCWKPWSILSLPRATSPRMLVQKINGVSQPAQRKSWDENEMIFYRFRDEYHIHNWFSACLQIYLHPETWKWNSMLLAAWRSTGSV